MSTKNSDYYFLSGGGEMGELIRAKDWSKTALGDPAEWPQSLRTMVAVMLDNPFGMYIAWGSEYTQLYNDGYRPILGATKHPHALGISTRETFSEIWHIIESMFDGVMKGKAVGFPDFMLPLNRNGFVEECYFDFSYSPIRKDNGEVGGVLVTVIETTNRKKADEALKESEARFRAIADDAPVFIFLAGENAAVDYLNETWREYTGISTEDSKGRAWAEITHPDDVDPATKIYMDGFNNRVSCSFENRQKGTDGIYRTILWKATPRFSLNGQFIGMMGVGFDIDERKKSEEKLRESEQRLRLANEASGVAVWEWNVITGQIKWDNEMFKIYGVTPTVDNLVDYTTWSTAVVPEELAQQENILQNTVKNKGQSSRSFKIKRASDGELRHIEAIEIVRTNAAGQAEWVVGTNLDVTEKMVAQKKVEDSEKRYNLMLMQSPFAFLILKGKDLVVRLANESMKEVLGKGSDIEGKPLLEVLPELKGQAFPDLLLNVYNTGIPFSANEMLAKLTRNGNLEDVYFNYVYQPYYEADNTISGVTVIAYDVTSSVIANKKIEASEQRLNIVIDASELGTYELNLKTKEPKYSKRYLEILGGYKEEIKLSHEQLLQHLHPDDLPIREKAFKESIITGHLHYEARLIWNDNSIHWMEGKGKVFYDEENNPEKLIGTIRDITEEKDHEQELKESEYKFRLLADSMPQHIWTSDPQGNLNYFNESVFAYSGLTLEQINKDGWIQIVHPDDREENIKQWINSITTGKDFLFEHRFKRYDGEYRWQLSRAIPQKDENGKIQMWVGTSTDINEQKKALEQFKMLADQAPMWVWLTDKEVNILYTNPEVLKFLGIAHYTEFTGNMWEQKVHPEDIAMVYKTFGEAASLQQSFSFEFRVQNAKTHQYEWFYIKAVPRLEDGEFTGFIGTGININEQKTFAKELEEKVITRTAELKASEEKFYNLFNLSPISKTLSDTSSGKIVMVNDAFTKLFGYSREVALGKSSAELGLLDLEEREIIINELKTNGKIENREIGFIKKSGEKFIALASAEFISIGDKKFFLSAFNDISEIKKAEQNIRQKNIELEKMNKELQSFAYISSHDLQEPLRKIQTFATRITEKEENNLSDYGKDMFNRMQEASKRMQTLIQDLLAYSRTNTTDRKFENTDLNKIIQEVKEDFEEELNEKHATIEANELCDAAIIPFQFRQLMHNLIGNSLKFSKPENPPHIQIKSEIAKGIKLNNQKLSPQINYCHITVSDNGIGFEQQYSEKIFEVFQRLHGKNEYNGTGIGLSIVKKIVENHNGIITANGELNKGATFEIYIPAT